MPYDEAEIKREWEQIYKKESAVLYGYLLKKTDSETAQDIMHDSFIKLLDAMKKKTIQNIRAYLFQISRNQLINEMRKKNNASEEYFDEAELLPQHESINNTENALIKKELLENLNEAVKQLSPKEKEIFELKFSFDMKQHEIADVLKKSDRQIRRDLENLIRKLRDYFVSQGWKIEEGLDVL